MKIFINGKIKEAGVIEPLITQIINGIGEKIDIPEDTEFNIEGLEFKVSFNLEGKEQYVTVPREVKGEIINELLMVSIHVDEEGNIIQVEDNEKESFYDDYTLAKAVGKEYEYTGTESKYKDHELVEEEVIAEACEDTLGVRAVRYSVKNKPEIDVVRHYKEDLLVAEYEYKPKKIK